MSLLTWILIGVVIFAIVLLAIVVALVQAIRSFLAAAESVLDDMGWKR